MMENLKEIDLLLMAVPEGIHDNAWVQNAIKMLRDIAEIAKENEPVAFVQATPDGNLMLAEITKTAEAQPLDQWDRQMGWTLVPLYAFPPSTEQIENRVLGY